MKLKIYMRKLQLYDENQNPVWYNGVNPNSLNTILGLIPDNDWREMTRYIDNLDEFSASWKAKEKAGSKGISNVDKSVSTELILFDEAYNFVTQWLRNHPASPLNGIEVRVEIENCGVIDEYVIKRDGISYCDNDYCNLEVNLKQKDDLYTCIYSTLITDNHINMFDGNYQHPRFSYCNEFRPVGILIALFSILTIIASVVFIVLAPILVIIQIIENILDSIPGVNVDFGIPSVNEFRDMIVNIYVDIFGCGREHPAPLIRDYIRNVCSKCGITVTQTTAPIFFDPQSKYYNLTMLSAECRKGVDKDSNNFWIKDNDPLMTLDMLLDKIKPLFNAKWFIKNNMLYFNRHDKFDNDAFLYDFVGLDKNLVLDSICYTWNEEKKGAFCKIGYTIDGFDNLTSDCLRRYNDIVEYNTPTINPLLEGEDNRITNDFAPIRFRNDGVYKDYVEQTMEITSILSLLLTIGIGSFIINKVKSKMNLLKYCIIMQNHTAIFSKLIIWNGKLQNDGTKRNSRAVREYKSGGSMPNPNAKYNPTGKNYLQVYNSDEVDSDNGWLINYPMFFDAMFKGNLWDFHEIDDPRHNPPTNNNFTLSIPLCCEELNKLGILNNSGNVQLERKVKINGDTFYQEGVIKGIEIDFNSKNKLGKHIKIRGRI